MSRDRAEHRRNKKHRKTYLVRRQELARRLDVTIRTLDRMREAKGFPSAIFITDRIPAWRWAEIESWIASRKVAN